MKSPIETKVIAAAAGAGGGGVVNGFLMWLLGVTLWAQPSDAASAVKAAEAVPFPVSAFVGLVLVVAGAALGGYKAPHTERPDLTAAAEDDHDYEYLHPGSGSGLEMPATMGVDYQPADPTPAPAAAPAPTFALDAPDAPDDDATSSAEPIPQSVLNATSVVPGASASAAGTAPLTVTPAAAPTQG